MVLARNNNTPIFDWMKLSLPELHRWIVVNNELGREEREARHGE